jgi:site-specific DNA-methyltransferase (adenine-specific)
MVGGDCVINQIIHGDCLVESEQIESGSVDLILTDLPYGTMNGYNGIDWDFAIDPDKVYEIANRILRKNGKMVLFSQEPYSSRLINEAIPNVPFSYRMVWEKDSFANALVCNKAPVSFYEDILVFSKSHDTDGIHPLREYFAKVLKYIGKTRSKIIETIGQRVDHTFRTNSTQYALCTEATYDALITEYGIDRMDGFIPYEELVEIDRKTKDEHFPSVFNLWEGGKYKSNILRYKKDYDGFHPTQKPVLLLEDLIKTYSNEGDLVVDLTMGSGSTAIACINTGRSFIGIEKEPKYVELARKRVKEHKVQLRLAL